MRYQIFAWMLRRGTRMPVHAIVDGLPVVYVKQADPVQLCASVAIQVMAEEATANTPICPCCKSADVTLERNEIARWIQCHHRRCGLTHFAATNPEVDSYFEEAATA